MAHFRLAADTAPEIERAKVAAWRAMTPAQKAATVSGLATAAFAMAMAGVRHRCPVPRHASSFSS